MRVHTLEQQVFLPAPRDEVFAFFSDPFNLEELTPPWLQFRTVTSSPITMEVGALIDYRLKVRGIPIRWRSKITAWEPPVRFVDEQVAGPYRVWIHEHTFQERDAGTLAGDRIRYAIPWDAFLHALVVRRDLEKIFAYREKRLNEIFSGERAAGCGPSARE